LPVTAHSDQLSSTQNRFPDRIMIFSQVNQFHLVRRLTVEINPSRRTIRDSSGIDDQGVCVSLKTSLCGLATGDAKARMIGFDQVLNNGVARFSAE